MALFMDFDAAIQAHFNWKKRLALALQGDGDKLDAETVSRDDLCELGHWLYGEGKALMAGEIEYEELIMTHAEFHREAGALIRKLDQGLKEQVQNALDDPSSGFSQTSALVVSLLMKLRGVTKHGSRRWH